ncbi:MAG: GntR family transcriptional regulator [Candidatus Eiseniibacteriota bacterium]
MADDADQPKLLGDRAYEAVREDIISCRLGPGVGFSEAWLAAWLGVGKAPVRTALVRLAQEGLVQAMPRRGYRVAPITLRDVQELFALRLMLEPQAAELAAGRIAADHLHGFDAAYRPGGADSVRDLLLADCDFHMAVVHASGNRRLIALVQNLMDDMERLLHAGLQLEAGGDEIRRAHAALVEALAGGDGAVAARLTARRIEDTRRLVIDALMTSPALLEVPVTFEPIVEQV